MGRMISAIVTNETHKAKEMAGLTWEGVISRGIASLTEIPALNAKIATLEYEVNQRKIMLDGWRRKYAELVSVNKESV